MIAGITASLYYYAPSTAAAKALPYSRHLRSASVSGSPKLLARFGGNLEARFLQSLLDALLATAAPANGAKGRSLLVLALHTVDHFQESGNGVGNAHIDRRAAHHNGLGAEHLDENVVLVVLGSVHQHHTDGRVEIADAVGNGLAMRRVLCHIVS